MNVNGTSVSRTPIAIYEPVNHQQAQRFLDNRFVS